MNNANKFMFFNIKIKKTISQELFFAGSSYRTPYIKNININKKDIEGIVNTNKKTNSFRVLLNNKVYFCSNDNNVYEYNPETKQQKIIITADGPILLPGFVLNNKLYFILNNGQVYEYDPATSQQKIVTTADGPIPYAGVVLNDKLYKLPYNYLYDQK
ncbi:hypothetical protein D9R21_06050 [Spiroplasma endosymbiont of Megaselia nigra]|nr:hypothetical protein D9R21_06050 [Spiroplasma endosymbiont of Megaselia nigra]